MTDPFHDNEGRLLRRRAVIVVVCAFAFIVMVLTLTIGAFWPSSQPKTRGTVAASMSSPEEIHAANERASAMSRLSSATSKYEGLLADCNVIRTVTLPESANNLCRTEHEVAARAHLKAKSYVEASAALNAALNEGLSSEKARTLRSQIDRAMGFAEAEARREQERTNQVERIAYGMLLRNRLLDKGMDVKVSVTGTRKDRITLTWVLMNDVWTHQMQKEGGVVPEMKRLGFRRADATDGYDYHVYWDLK